LSDVVKNKNPIILSTTGLSLPIKRLNCTLCQSLLALGIGHHGIMGTLGYWFCLIKPWYFYQKNGIDAIEFVIGRKSVLLR